MCIVADIDSLPSVMHPHVMLGTRARVWTIRASAEGSVKLSDKVYRVKLRKPLGLVLSERKPTGEVFVEEVVASGNAAKQGTVQPGDIVRQCSATVLKAGKEGEYEKEGYGKRPYDNWERIMFDCRGQDFDTVMSAISSNNERWGIMDVTLELERPTDASAQS